MSPDRPTDVMPESGGEPTDVMPGGPGAATEVIGEPPPPPPPQQPPPASGGNRGVGILVASIVASLVLVGAYVAAGGLDNGPDKPADPCDARPWTDPQDLEEAAQQFALSAADGAACELGVSREELTRSIAEEGARQDFMDRHGFSDADLEEALRAGLNRAVDDAEQAGVIGGLPASGIRAAIKVMPTSVMIGLLENADSIFNGDLGSLGGIGDVIGAITGGAGKLGSGTTDDPLDSLGDLLDP